MPAISTTRYRYWGVCRVFINRIFSSLHVSGEKLGNLSGVAAILRFPVPGIDDTDDEDDSSSDDDRDDDAAADGS